MTKTEAETLAKATAEVAKYYPTAIDPKTIAWVNLATCIGLVYGPRVYVVRARLDREKRTRGIGNAAPVMADVATDPASFIAPGFSGAVGPVADASTM